MRNKKLYKQDALLYIITALGWLAVAVAVVVLCLAVRHLTAVRRFRNDFTSGIAYAQQNLSMTASYNGGEQIKLKEQDPGMVHRLVTSLMLRSQSYPEHPEQEARFFCGDGTELHIGVVDSSHLCIRLINDAGKQRCFSVTMGSADRWFLGFCEAFGLI